jgi:signal peptidase I
MMICDRFHVSRIDAENSPRFPSLRFAVGKLLEPKRWDMVVFRYPEDPSTLYAMRLVGLPGEQITIQDGAVWADGQKLTMPKELEGLEYLDRIPGFPGVSWGTIEDPAKLGDDEYFVLGDFSALAKDSRLWQDGAPGHPPYAVPRSHFYGVVTTVYWPPDRWRAIH